MKSIINVLVVEDSPVAQLLLVHVLDSDPRVHVIGTANNGDEALAFLERRRPDVVVMDIHMPGMDGYETTRRIMETWPLPIIVCSASLNPREVQNTFRAMEAGALALVPKPVGLGHHDYERMASALIDSVVTMAEVKVVKRWPRNRSNTPSPVAGQPRPAGPIRVVAVGASTGGPPVLKTILDGLDGSFGAPIVIVQHIAPGFLAGMIDWLNQSSGCVLKIAEHGEQLLAGHAYMAPDGHHTGIDAAGRVVLSEDPPENCVRPSVAHLFRSVATSCRARAIGVLLTGMGRDGAAELKLLRQAGAITLAQDKASCVVHGMSGEAIRLEAADHVLAPAQIAPMLIALTGRAAGNARNAREDPR